MTIVCRHCNASEGFYVRERVVGTSTMYYTNTGDCKVDQHSMYDNLKHSGGKIAYCTNCHKSIGKSENLKSGNVEEVLTFY